MAREGRVCTGFSKPYVAVYSASGGTVTYTGGMELAAGVDVELSLNASEAENGFYANNVIKESEAAGFSGGTFSLTVDGLLDAARKLIFGLPQSDEAGWTNYGNTQSIPACGLGWVTRWMSDGVTSYEPTVLTRVIFDPENQAAKTQAGTSIEWQTTRLSGKILRDETDNQTWKAIGTEGATEAEAVTALKTKLGITG